MIQPPAARVPVDTERLASGHGGAPAPGNLAGGPGDATVGSELLAPRVAMAHGLAEALGLRMTVGGRLLTTTARDPTESC